MLREEGAKEATGLPVAEHLDAKEKCRIGKADHRCIRTLNGALHGWNVIVSGSTAQLMWPTETHAYHAAKLSSRVRLGVWSTIG